MPIYITEYTRLGQDRYGTPVAAGVEPCVAEQKLTISGTSGQTSAFNAVTAVVMVHTTEVCSIKFGADPTAAATTQRLAANETRYYCVTPGHKMAGITNT